MKDKTKRPKSQIKTDKIILKFLSDFKIISPDDLLSLKDKIVYSLKSRPYDAKTKKQADNIQWTRTASEILKDGYVYSGKACSDIVIVFLALCKASGIDGRLVKLRNTSKKETHSIVEVKFKNSWYRFDPSAKNAILHKGILTSKLIRNKEWKIWKKGKDVWDLGLFSIDDEKNIFI